MIRLLHVLDGGTGETELRSVKLLLDRMASDPFEHHVVATDSGIVEPARRLLGCEVHRAEKRLWLASWSAPALRKIFRADRISMIHAWGSDALAACKAAGGDQPLVVSGIRPAESERKAALLRQIRPTPIVIAPSQVARSQLSRFGVNPHRIAVIRSAVDFAAINEAKRSDARRRLVDGAGPVVFAAGTAERDGGQFETLWACAMLQQIFPHIRVVVAGDSPEVARLHRMAGALGLQDMLVAAGTRFNLAELTTAADVAVAAPADEIDSQLVGWIMAAGTPFVGVAKRSIAELIADRSNGLLCINNQPRRIAATLLRLLEDADLARKIADTARGQAYEVFSARAFLENMQAVYLNTANGRTISEGVVDMAMSA